MGNGTGTELGSGILGGVGPGRDGGFGDRPFSARRVIAPRENYSSDPEYSKTGQKGEAAEDCGLVAMVAADGG
jgi:hypothetical protein